MKIKQHKESGLWVREDGAVLMPPTGGNFKKFRFTYGCKNKKGYMVVRYRGKLYFVHRLVAEAFNIPNPEGYREIDHYPDRNRSNNAVSNLRWANRKMQADNTRSVDRSIAKYGVRPCEDSARYQREYRAKNPEFIKQQCVYRREYYAKQKALGRRQRKCPDGKCRLLTDAEFNALYKKD